MVVVEQTLTPTMKFPAVPTQAVQKIKNTGELDLSTHPVRPLAKLTTRQRNVFF